MNYLNFFNHISFTPTNYLRRYDLDLEPEPEKASRLEEAKRVALVALPFVALHRPFGSALSLAMGGCRVISHLHLCLQWEKKGDWFRLSWEMAETALATGALAASIFGFVPGLIATNAIDTGKGCVHTLQFCLQGHFPEATKEALQTLASALYLTFMLTGSLELILLSSVVQAALCLYQAKGEFDQNRKLESFAKLIMTAIHLYQARGTYGSIQRRNFLFSLEKYQAFAAQASRGKAVRHLVHHTLTDLNGKIDEKQVLLSNQDQEYDFGSHFHGLGKGLVKGANLTFHKKVIDGKEMIECEFKVNHVHRKKLQQMLGALSKLSPKETREILQFTGSHAKEIHVKNPNLSDDDFWFWGNESSLNKTHTIIMNGLGTVNIGAHQSMPNLYDKVTIHMDQDKTLYDLHELMALTQLDEALCLSSNDDIDRLKIGHLFRTFFPREATPFERTEDFFSLPTEELKATIIKKAPQMQELFDKYLDRMSQAEILPGKVRYRIDGLSDEVYEKGGRALTAAITGAYYGGDDLYEKVASLLSMGFICQEQKDSNGLNSSGYGGSYLHGGADAVYTQMITEQQIQNDPNLNSLQYRSKVRFLISLDALSAGTYQYFDDDYGTRIYDSSSNNWWFQDTYAKRPSILELTEQLQKTPTFASQSWNWWRYSGHEIMLKERIDPSLFQGLMVDAEATRIELLNYLRNHHLVQKNALGQETILGKPVNEFIRVGKEATQALI